MVQRDVIEPVAVVLLVRQVGTRAAVGECATIVEDGGAGFGQLRPHGLILGRPRREGQIVPFGCEAARHDNFVRLRSTIFSKCRSEAAVSVPA